MTIEQFQATISNQFPTLKGEFSLKNNRLQFKTFRNISGISLTEYQVIYSQESGRWYVGTPWGGCGRHTLEAALDAVKALFPVSL